MSTPTAQPVQAEIAGLHFQLYPLTISASERIQLAYRASILAEAAEASQLIESPTTRAELLRAALKESQAAKLNTPAGRNWFADIAGIKALLASCGKRNGAELQPGEITEIIEQKNSIALVMLYFELVNGPDPTKRATIAEAIDKIKSPLQIAPLPEPTTAPKLSKVSVKRTK